jgi:carbon-monoxide dehydrogenase large subunit
MPLNTINHLPGPYRVSHYRATGTGVVTHKTFSGAYRGAGRPEAAFVLDRLLDRAARALGMDPAELRRRNIVRAGEMPYPTGLSYRDGAPITYDPGDYAAGFELALSRLGYEDWRAEQRRRRGRARPLGLGVSAYVEGTGIGPFRGPTFASIRAARCISSSASRARDRPTRPWPRSARRSWGWRSTRSAWSAATPA